MLTGGYKSRLVEKQFDEYIQTFGAVCIEGQRNIAVKPGQLEASTGDIKRFVL